jgi:NADPH2:quinone reductase
MKAAVYERSGPAAEVLRITDVPQPEPGAGEVRVRIQASGVNPTDWKSRAGATPRPIDEFQVPNQDGAGVIDAVGEGVDPGRVGQRVWVWMAAAGRRWGTAAEWTVVPAERAVRLPDGISMEFGASLGVPAITAHRCLFADGPLDGKAVLVAGGAGAVGHFAIELAKWAGARVVTTVSNPEKAKLAAEAGADLVVNYTEAGAADQIRAFAPRFDRIVEVALGPNLELDLSICGPETVVVTYAADGPDPVLPVRACMTANVTLRFILLYSVPEPALRQAAADITDALEEGALTGLPVHHFRLDDCAAAHEAVEGRAVGKVIIDLAEEEPG